MREEIKHDECQYLYDFPVLVLAVRERYNFKEGRDWIYIAHQTAGNACHQHYMIGTILQPKPEILDKMRDINDYWLETNCGVCGVALDEIIEYRKQLNELLAVDCNLCYEEFEEGIYPIDCTAENIRKLTLDDIPDNPDDFIVKEPSWKFIPIGAWNLYILGDNSD
ncbi:MAG: hypothetical protein QMD97_04935 [Candidatus Aenigmarchaeota archaeon]|nr:hypothetical protein [Candidatus Aenigmarchaeota archaeon]